MARGPKKHLKRLNAPKSWLLDKLSGVFAPRPKGGRHKIRECLPMVIFLRNRLKYALTGVEVRKIVRQRHIKVDNRVRTNARFPIGFMDVVSIPRTGENFRMMYDAKGRFVVHRVTAEEARYKLCKVLRLEMGKKSIPFVTTHDGRTIRFPDPLVKAFDSVLLDLDTGKMVDFVKFAHGHLCMVVGGRNLGRVGVVVNRERHPGSFDIVHLRDAVGHNFATRLSNIFMIGKGEKSLLSLPRGAGIKLSDAQERDIRLARKRRLYERRNRQIK